MAWDDEYKNALLATSQKYGIDPLDLGTVQSYETGGTLDPWQKGPTTKWGEHRGLIQWGEPQRQQYGISQNSSLQDQMDASVKYLMDRGYKPGMSMTDMYSAINAGAVGRNNWSDAKNGGAPGTVADKVNNQMGEHRAKMAAFLGQQPGATASRQPAGADAANQPAPDAQTASVQAPPQGAPPQGSPGATAPRSARAYDLNGKPVTLGGNVENSETYKNSFAQGGPGALFGMGQKDWSAGDALIGTSMALMAMSGNHQAAGAIAQLLNKGREKSDKNNVTYRGTVADGKFHLFTDGNGNTRYVPIDAQYQDAADTNNGKDPSGVIQRDITANNSLIARNKETLQESDKLLDDMASGKVDYGILKQGEATFKNLLGQSDENALKIDQSKRILQNLVEDRLNMEKGGSTNEKLKQVMSQVVPQGTAQYDNAQWEQALRFQRKLLADRTASTLDGQALTMRNNTRLSQDKTGDVPTHQLYSDDAKSIRETHSQKEKQWDEMKKNRAQPAPQGGQPGQPADGPRVMPGRAPEAGSTGGTGGSFSDFMRRKRQGQ